MLKYIIFIVSSKVMKILDLNNLLNLDYPISTLPEHLHSTSLSYAETT